MNKIEVRCRTCGDFHPVDAGCRRKWGRRGFLAMLGGVMAGTMVDGFPKMPLRESPFWSAIRWDQGPLGLMHGRFGGGRFIQQVLLTIDAPRGGTLIFNDTQHKIPPTHGKEEITIQAVPTASTWRMLFAENIEPDIVKRLRGEYKPTKIFSSVLTGVQKSSRV